MQSPCSRLPVAFVACEDSVVCTGISLVFLVRKVSQILVQVSSGTLDFLGQIVTLSRLLLLTFSK